MSYAILGLLWLVSFGAALLTAKLNREFRDLRDEWVFGRKRNVVIVGALMIVTPPLYILLAILDWWLRIGSSSSSK